MGDHGAELLWIPLGAGQRVVRASGRVVEALAARAAHRDRAPLYHSALVLRTADGAVTIEMAPTPDAAGDRRGVVAVGPVGIRLLGRFRLFRYEIRCWPDGVIPDAEAAVARVDLGLGEGQVRQNLESAPTVPTPVWGRDELGAGEMWNSNSVVSWLLAVSGVDLTALRPPSGGRAPGWDAGRVVAERAAGQSASSVLLRPSDSRSRSA